ncbi:BQ2448_5453 [Microbotryum intermedium]|uniref:BQ2448_5453 protein n=1 Tax=Microbotryum intermedium TaxID=269621 RepID=A0A238F100_9BASI|nr:BQ2448_5453 [Microbotryum intermedium]
MVWILHGTVDCRAERAPAINSIPPRTSHLLRPGRTYRLGRLPDPAQKVKNRLHDFYLNSPKISKSGTWKLTIPSLLDGASTWSYEDDPTNPNNLDPYPLVLKGKVTYWGSDGKPSPIEGASVHVKPGDTFIFGSLYEMTFEWVPLIFAISSATVAKKNFYADLAKSIGFKIAYQTFRPHHTHYLTKKLTPNASLMSAALVGSHVADPSYLDKLAAFTTCETPPASEMPRPRPKEADLGDRDSAAVLAWEAEVYDAHQDAGSDPEHWWGKSILEADWSVLPTPVEFPCNIDPQFPAGTTEGWSPNPQRKTMFRDVMVLPFQEEPEGDPSGLLELGGAHLISRDMLPLDRPISALRSAIDDYKQVSALQNDVRFAIIPPEGFEPFPAPNEPAKFKTVRQLAQALGETKFVGHPMVDLLQAIYDADPSPLLGPLVMVPPTPTPEIEGSPGARASLSRTATTTSNHTPFPSSGVPYTLEDQSAPSTASVQTQAPASSEEAASSAPAPTVVRKLKRHARNAPRTLDMLFGLDKPSTVEADEASSHAPELDPVPPSSLPAVSSMDLDVPSSSQTVGDSTSKPAPTARRFLKRRAVSGDPDPSQILFDYVGSSSSSVPEAKKPRYDPTTREERLRRIQEEDDAEAAKEMGRKRAGKVVAPDENEVEVEVNMVTPNAGRGRKRSIDQTVEEGDMEENAEHLTTKKGKVRTKTVSKRARSESVQPPVLVHDEQENRPSVSESSPKKAAATKSKGKGKASNEVVDDEAEVEQAPVLLQVKAKRGKGKAALMEQALNDDFNRLKIVKPDFKRMIAPERHRMTWDEVDTNEERMRLIREDHEEMEEQDGDDPNHWAGKSDGMFVIKKVHFPRPQKPKPRYEDSGQWAGRANFKAFKPKEALGAAKDRREPRPEVRLAPIKRTDYGIGENYKSKGSRNPGMLGSQSQTQSQSRLADDEDDDDFGMDGDGFQPMLKFESTAKARTATATKSTKSISTASKSKDSKSKGKGKAKITQVSIESDDDPFSSDDVRPSRVISDVEEADEMEVDDSDAGPSKSTASKGKSSSAASRTGSSITMKQASSSLASSSIRQPRAKAPAVPASRKLAVAVLSDSSDESDSGLTFKGFEANKCKR